MSKQKHLRDYEAFKRAVEIFERDMEQKHKMEREQKCGESSEK